MQATDTDLAADGDGGDEFERALRRAWTLHRDNDGGQVADYIPELSKAAPNDFGLAIATVGGKLYTIGDVEVEFTIQSISKAFMFCLAIEIAGHDFVAQRVGIEPSGDPFNAIVFDDQNRPFNPMVNAGAIAIAGIIYKKLGSEAFDFVMERFSAAAGRPLSLNEKVYKSEDQTGHRNRGIAHLLLASGAMAVKPERALDLYFRQCSINVTAGDIARMGATMANMGKNPATKKSAFDLQAVRSTLAVMFTCGMYDYAGAWAYDVGVPAKSGVGGGILGVVNRQLGIGSYSPRLDAKGNSVRGVAAFETLAEDFGLHAFDCTNIGSSYVSSLIR
jgi:glutaminase